MHKIHYLEHSLRPPAFGWRCTLAQSLAFLQDIPLLATLSEQVILSDIEMKEVKLKLSSAESTDDKIVDLSEFASE